MYRHVTMCLICICTQFVLQHYLVLCVFYFVMQEVDNLMIRRFLRARDLDIEEASNLFLKYLGWRRAFVPSGSIATSEIPNELAHNKLFMQGLDKMGRPIVVCFGGRHKQNNLEEFKRMLWLQNYIYFLNFLSSWKLDFTWSIAKTVFTFCNLPAANRSWCLAKWTCLYFLQVLLSTV